MPEIYEIRLDIEVDRFLRNLDQGESRFIRKNLNDRLSISPASYGTPLRGDLQGFWKLRISRWRVFYEIIETKHQVNVLLIDNRDEHTYDRVRAKLGK